MVEGVYNAVRTDSLYKADYVSSLKGKISLNRRQDGPQKRSGGGKNLVHLPEIKLESSP